MQSPKIDCNYEVLPADTYCCSPDDCVPVYALPSATASTIPFSFVQDYIYLNPSAFGLSVDAIFDVETTLTSTKTYKSTSTACKSSHSALFLPKLIFQLIHRRLLIPLPKSQQASSRAPLSAALLLSPSPSLYSASSYSADASDRSEP